MRLVDKSILVIDDDPIMQVLLKRVLENAGCKTSNANGIKAALKQIEEFKPDLVILDLNMPDLDGFEFLKFRKVNKFLQHTPVIILSGTEKKGDIQRALEMGAEQFIPKPLEARIILQKLRYTFLKRENFFYRLPPEDVISIDAKIEGEITGYCTGKLKVSSQVKFTAGKSLVVDSENFQQSDGFELVTIIDPHMVELKNGEFHTPLSVTGLSSEDKKNFEKWQGKLSE